MIWGRGVLVFLFPAAYATCYGFAAKTHSTATNTASYAGYKLQVTQTEAIKSNN